MSLTRIGRPFASDSTIGLPCFSLAISYLLSCNPEPGSGLGVCEQRAGLDVGGLCSAVPARFT